MPDAFEASAGRLDAVVAERLGIPRAEAQRAIAAGRVLVDGHPRPKSHRLAGGERVEVDLAGASDVPAEGPPVPVAYADEHLLVVDKPAGLPTHPTENHRSGTLVNRLLGMGVPLSTIGGPLRPGIVHRLDAGTSGLMIVARDDETHRTLAAMMKRHAVDRRYLALVRGVPDADRFAVDAALGRVGARVRVDVTGGREAETALEIRERFERSALLEAAPRTGRTHQIRVHLATIGHPILGDRRYGGGGTDADALGLRRPFLHSRRIAFDHPVTGQRIELESELPEDLRIALERVRGSGGSRSERERASGDPRGGEG
jgi:23S rRNA pseudouridine1911/1915/1917 synthase